MDTKKMVLNAWKGVSDTVKGAGETIKNYNDARKQDDESVKKIIKEFYPSSTVVGDRKWGKRKNEFKKIYKTQGPIQAIKKAKEYSAQFKKDNPEWSGK
jgi:hypothetical protein